MSPKSDILIKLEKDYKSLEQIIQPYRWSNSSSNKIQACFESIRKSLNAMHAELITDLSRGLPRTDLVKGSLVPDNSKANMGMYQGLAKHCIDRISRAYKEEDQYMLDSAIEDTIDLGKLADRLNDPEFDEGDGDESPKPKTISPYFQELLFDEPPQPPTRFQCEKTDPKCVQEFIKNEPPDNPFESTFMKHLKGKKFIRIEDIPHIANDFHGYKGTLLSFHYDNGIPRDKTFNLKTEVCLFYNDNNSLVTINHRGEEIAYNLSAVSHIMIEVGMQCQVWYYDLDSANWDK
jgi:hypothetical protein